MNAKEVRHIDLFSGIGGFALAASWTWGERHNPLAFCEIEPFAQRVLARHWPGTPIISDIREFKGDCYGRVDLITGGFPCQPFSAAGKKKGKEDDRYLWPEMCRVIAEAKPSWVCGENVIGIDGMALAEVLSDLESEGYEVQTLEIPACAVGAPHIRHRTWILAHHVDKREWEAGRPATANTRAGGLAACSPQGCGGYWPTFSGELPGRWEPPRYLKPMLGKSGYGISNRMDEIRGMGNAIVPAVAARIFAAIKQEECP